MMDRIRIASVVAALLLLAGGCSEKPAPIVAPPTVQVESQETSDADVTTGVKAALLRDAALKSFDIAVVTTKGDVRLTGQVNTQPQVDAALVVVRSIKGVHSIHDELVVKK